MNTRARCTTAALILVAAATATCTASVATAATARPAPASVTGSAQIRLTFAPDDDVRTFGFDAHARPYSRPLPGLPSGLPTDAYGTVTISHRVAADGTTVRMEAQVDCLATAPGTATLTAIVTRADGPVRDHIGKRLGLSVYDGGRDGAGHSRDRVGFSWAVVNGVQDDTGEWAEGKVGTCMGPAPYAPVTAGGYTVRHADLPAPPTAR